MRRRLGATVGVTMTIGRLVLAAALALGVAACGSGSNGAAGTPSTTASSAGSTTATAEPSPTMSETPNVPSRVVEFPSSVGGRLVGRLFAPGRPRAVVLAHQIDDDQTDWFDFAKVLASHGFTVLTFNFEGYCGGGGCSRGDASAEELWTDVAGAVDYVRDQGTERVGLLGASMGGEAVMVAAARLGSDVAAVVTLSASMGLVEPGPGAARRDVAGIEAPKLFVSGRFDSGPASAARAFDRAAAEPKRLVLLPYGEHGVDLLRWEPGERTTSLLIGFFGHALR
jgi:pimeloyl-ACP methyl ester carboxylesterase